MLDNISSEHGYAAWGERLVAEGWTPYLLTFMFRPIGGSAAHVAEVMEAEVVRVQRDNQGEKRASIRMRNGLSA